MANVGGFNLETPQEALGRVKAQRQKELGSNNPLLLQSAIFGQALDSLFGNPEVRAAQLTQDRIKEAVASTPEGRDAIETEQMRLTAIYDKVQDLDPNLADQLRTRLVGLEQMRVERNKLLAGEQRDNDTSAVNLLLKANDSTTWINPKNGEMVEVRDTDTARQAELIKLGYVTRAPSTENESKAVFGDRSAPTPKTTSDLQETLLTVDRNLARMGSIGSIYKPAYSKVTTQAAKAILNAGDKVGVPLAKFFGPAEVADLAQYNSWASQSLNNLNLIIKDITGASMSVQEAERIKATAPNPDMGTSAYLASARSTVKTLLAARLRAQWALSAGLGTDGKTIEWEKLGSLDTFGNVSEDAVDLTMTQMFGDTGRGKAAPSGPQSAADRARALGL